MKELVINLGEKAKNSLSQSGDEFYLYKGVVGSGWAARRAVLVENGKPEDSNYYSVTDGGLTFWVPEDMEFINDTLEISAKGYMWNNYIIATSAIAERKWPGMSELSLQLSDKALEYMQKNGKEFRIIEKTISAGWRGTVKAILVESGTKPSDEYKPLKQDDITVWAPGFLDFKDDTIKIDLGGLPWSKSLKLVS